MLSPATRVDARSLPRVLAQLRLQPGRHAWALQDLTVWPAPTTCYIHEPAGASGPFGYLLLSGHPAVRGTTTLVMDGAPEAARALLAHIPKAPWVLRETPAELLPVLREHAPQAKVYLEQRMEVTREAFVPQLDQRPLADASGPRRLVEGDAAALAEFNGAPPQAAGAFVPWIQGACLFGIWAGGRLVATASTFVQIPEVWELVSIVTRQSERRKGYAAAVTSALTAVALQSAPVVSLTVLKDNEPAQSLYAKLGFRACEDRIWVDNGANAAPHVKGPQ